MKGDQKAQHPDLNPRPSRFVDPHSNRCAVTIGLCKKNSSRKLQALNERSKRLVSTPGNKKSVFLDLDRS